MSATPEQKLRDVLSWIDTDPLPNELADEVEWCVHSALAWLGDPISHKWIEKSTRCPYCGDRYDRAKKVLKGARRTLLLGFVAALFGLFSAAFAVWLNFFRG